MTVPEEALLDWLDTSPSCDVHTCRNAADWWLVCAACNQHRAMCEPCHQLLEADAVTDRRTRFVCPGCLETVAAPRWRELFVLIPIEAI